MPDELKEQSNNKKSCVVSPSKAISLEPPQSRAFLDTTEKPEANIRPSTAHVSDCMNKVTVSKKGRKCF